jgi:hypothetical protein
MAYTWLMMMMVIVIIIIIIIIPYILKISYILLITGLV